MCTVGGLSRRFRYSHAAACDTSPLVSQADGAFTYATPIVRSISITAVTSPSSIAAAAASAASAGAAGGSRSLSPAGLSPAVRTARCLLTSAKGRGALPGRASDERSPQSRWQEIGVYTKEGLDFEDEEEKELKNGDAGRCIQGGGLSGPKISSSSSSSSHILCSHVGSRALLDQVMRS